MYGSRSWSSGSVSAHVSISRYLWGPVSVPVSQSGTLTDRGNRRARRREMKRGGLEKGAREGGEEGREPGERRGAGRAGGGGAPA